MTKTITLTFTGTCVIDLDQHDIPVDEFRRCEASGDLQEIIDRVIDFRIDADLDVEDVELVDSDLPEGC